MSSKRSVRMRRFEWSVLEAGPERFRIEIRRRTGEPLRTISDSIARCVSRSINRRVLEIVSRTPRDAALRIDTLEIANQQQPKIHPRWQTWPAHCFRVERDALGFGEVVEPVLGQQLIHSPVSHEETQESDKGTLH